jgi:hypothetical protein
MHYRLQNSPVLQDRLGTNCSPGRGEIISLE